jgi:GTP-binding protein
VSAPEIITHTDAQGRLHEPLEELIIDVPTEHQGVVIEKVSQRKGELAAMHTGETGMTRLEFRIPTRGLIGYRSEFLTDTRGLGIMASRFACYAPWTGEISGRNRGSMISLDIGDATGYSLENLQQRGTLFVTPLSPVYEGMIIGENSRPGDLICNPTKRKALTNHRASNKDQTVSLDVPRILTLDAAIEWVANDELVEVTPAAIRVRKTVLSYELRKKSEKVAAAAE